MPEWHAAISRHALDAEFGCFLIRRYDDPKPDMEFAGVEKAHAKSALCRSGRLHAFIDKPKASVAVQQVLKPNPRNPVPRGAPKKRKECLPHPLGQFEIGGVEFSCLGGEKNIECPPPTLVRLEECYVAEHLGGLIAFPQRYLAFDPQPELLGGTHKVRLIANGDRRAQNASHGSADRMIQCQRVCASHGSVWNLSRRSAH